MIEIMETYFMCALEITVWITVFVVIQYPCLIFAFAISVFNMCKDYTILIGCFFMMIFAIIPINMVYFMALYERLS